MHSSSPPSAAEQLREAKQRIAVLEQELARLRSTTPSPAGGTSSLQHARAAPPLKPRPSIMTRRAAAAAAAAAVNAVASDLSHRPSSAVRLAPKQSAHPSRSSSALSEPCSPEPSAECSEVSRGGSELSESPAASTKHRGDESLSSVEPETVDDAKCFPEPIGDTKGEDISFEAVTPELPTADAPAGKQVLLKNQRVLLTPSVVKSEKLDAQPDPADDEADRASKTPSTDTSNSDKVAIQPPRRRPPPLPVAKTSSTKKERHNLVAKCTEPKPGQTRYWTEEEHERFLEAVAEYGEKAYVAISNYVETRTPKQVRTHAQKFQMKMARLAKQSIDAGEPVQMPAGMSPVVQLHTNGKATLVPLHASGDNSGTVGNSLYKGLPARVPIKIMVPPSKQTFGKKKGADKAKPSKSAEKKSEPISLETKDEDALAKAGSTVTVETEETSSGLTDPYLDYIGGASDAKVGMELENTFAAKLCQTLQGSRNDTEPKGEFLMSDGASNDSGSTGDNGDDDLADLENLDDEDLSLAPFANPSESWLLPDASELPVV